MRRPGRLAVPAALALAAFAAATAHADTILSAEPSAPKISAAGGAVAWSTYDAALGAWFLVTRRAGVVERAAVAPRSVPFDVDLGRDGSGRLVAAYSRCQRDPDIAPTLGRGCDLYAYDLDTREERLLRGPSSDAASEYMPSLAHGRVAFGRVHERLAGPAGVRTTVYVRDLRRGPARRLPGGTRNDDDRTGLSGLDLGARRLALSWRTAGPAGPGIPYGTAELRVDSLRGGGQTVVTRLVGTYLDYGGIATPHLAGRRVRYGLIWVNEGGTTIGDVAEYDLDRGTRTSLRLPDRVAGVAVSGRETYYVRCNPEWMLTPGCEVAVRETAAGADPDVELERSARPSPLSWFRNQVAYSVYDASARSYRLTLRMADGTVERPAVRARSVPFDADLGRGPDGGIAAVYSRCRVEPRLGSDGLPLYTTGHGCRLYRYDTASRREVALRVRGYLPSIDRSRLAFARRTGLHAGTTRVATGDGSGPRALDLSGRRLAFVLDRRLRLVVRGGRARTVASGTIRSPGFDGNGLNWVQRDRGRNIAVRLDLATGARRVLVLPASATAYVPWSTWEGGSGSYARTGGAGWSLRTPLQLPELLR